METQLLRDPETYPTNEVLANALRDSYPALLELFDQITAPEAGLVLEWRYYNDGKAWLCKAVYKKKTVFWLSVSDGFFRTVFYFTEKHTAGIADLDIDPGIKEDFCSHKPVGKLLPLVIKVYRLEQVSDVLQLVRFKKGLK
jgi:hypothetical protein